MNKKYKLLIIIIVFFGVFFSFTLIDDNESWNGWPPSIWMLSVSIGIFIIQMFVAVLVPRSCPNCKEKVSSTMRKCPFCRTDMSFRVKK